MLPLSFFNLAFEVHLFFLAINLTISSVVIQSIHSGHLPHSKPLAVEILLQVQICFVIPHPVYQVNLILNLTNHQRDLPPSSLLLDYNLRLLVNVLILCSLH